MSQRRHLTLVAAAATLLAAMPMATVFDRWTWLIYAVMLVAALCGIALGVRSLQAPAWVPTLAMLGGYAVIMTWLFPSGKEYAGLIPNLNTLKHFGSLLGTAGEEMRTYGIPVEDRPGFMFLTTLGVGGVAIIIDLVAVVLRRPALAGLPMLAIYSVPVAVHQDSVSMWPFVAATAGFLWLLVTDNVDRVRRFGRRFTGDGRDIDAWEPSPLAAAGQRLGAIGIALAVLLPLAVPGMTEGLLSRFGGAAAGSGVGTGTGAGVGLEAMLTGELRRDKTISMLKVSSSDPNPYYLRFAIADQLNPNGFVARNAPRGRPTNRGLPDVKVGPGGSVNNYRATVDVLNFSTNFLPVYLQPVKIDVDDSWQWDDSQSVIFSDHSESQKKKYTFDYSRVEYSPEVLQRAKPLPPDNAIQQRFTQTPRVAEVDQLVNQLTAGKTTPYDKVRAIFDYFSPANGFSYSLTTAPGTSGSALLDFLTNKKGYCVQYSAALGWLVRAAGIPARVAFGFTRGNATAGSATTTLTNFNLHAWTEVYFDGYGWLPFDATPATNILGSVSPPYAPNPSRPTDAEAAPGDDTLPAAVPGASASAAAPGGEPGHSRPDAAGGSASPITQQWPAVTLLGVLVALLLLALPAGRRVVVRRRRLRFASDASDLAARQHAHAAWDELLDTMLDYRQPIDEAETPRATAERLAIRADLIDVPSAGVRLLGQAEERARYARTALPDGELPPALAAVRQALARRASRRTRLMATLLPPSVVQRWRLIVVGTSSQLFNGVARAMDRVTRTLSLRRLITNR